MAGVAVDGRDDRVRRRAAVGPGREVVASCRRAAAGSGRSGRRVEPWITVRVNGAACSSLPTESRRPAGWRLEGQVDRLRVEPPGDACC